MRDWIAMLAVLAPVVEDVGDRVPRLPRRLDDLHVVAVDEDLSLTALAVRRNQPAALRLVPADALDAALRDLGIDVLGGADLKALHAARERHPIIRLDDQVDVV